MFMVLAGVSESKVILQVLADEFYGVRRPIDTAGRGRPFLRIGESHFPFVIFHISFFIEETETAYLESQVHVLCLTSAQQAGNRLGPIGEMKGPHWRLQFQ